MFHIRKSVSLYVLSSGKNKRFPFLPVACLFQLVLPLFYVTLIIYCFSIPTHCFLLSESHQWLFLVFFHRNESYFTQFLLIELGIRIGDWGFRTDLAYLEMETSCMFVMINDRLMLDCMVE